MPDEGTKYTDEKQREIEARLRSIYEAASKDMIKMLNEHSEKMYARDEQKRQQLAQGKITKEQYRTWLTGQMFAEKIWSDKIAAATSILLTANQQANRIIEGERRAVFTENALYQAYKLEKDAGIGLSFAIYDSATITRLLKDQPELIPRRIPAKEVDPEKDKAWNREKISSVIARGIISGQSMEEIARNMAVETGNSNMSAMRRYSRTAMTGAQNAGRIEMLHEAEEMGIKVQKVWLATLDERTRHAHAMLDGQIQDVDKPFSSELGPIDYPGDPAADEANTWNCRCTLTYHYKEYPKQDSARYSQMDDEVIEDMTYEEWRQSRHPELFRKNVAQQATKPTQERVELEEPRGKSELVTNILPRAGIDTLPCARWDHTPTEDEIINLIAGADQTNGSCASVALAYVGNKAGYIVRDFRDGRSRDFFSTKANTKMLAQLPEVGGIIMNGKREISIANKLLATMEEGKQYWFGIGRHASIVRIKDGHYEYLELQSKYGNGWKRMYEDTLKWRFGCVKQRSFAMDARLMDVDKLAASDDFKAVLKYINTEEGKQRKGDGGGIK